MSFLKKLKHKVQHAANQAVHTVERTGSQVEHEVEHTAKQTAESVAQGVESAANAALKELNIVDNVVEKAFHEVEKKVEHLADDVKSEVLKVASDAKKEINELLDEAKQDIVKYAKEVIDDVHKGFGKLEHAFEAVSIQKAIRTSLKAAKKYPVYPNEIDLELPGGITFAWGDIPDKIGVLEEYANDPPHGRDQIMEFIEALAPNSITVQETIEIELLVISSSALEFGPSVIYTNDQVDAVLKQILDAAGVH